MLGFAIQLLVLKLRRTLWKRRLFVVRVLTGGMVCELVCRIVTGWDLPAVPILYGCVFRLAVGAVPARVVYQIGKQSGH